MLYIGILYTMVFTPNTQFLSHTSTSVIKKPTPKKRLMETNRQYLKRIIRTKRTTKRNSRILNFVPK